MGSPHRAEKIRREQVFKAASYLLKKKGYHDTTMDDIVKKSKLSKGSIYRFFKSKKSLFMNLLYASTGEFENEVQQIIVAFKDQPKVQFDKIIEIYVEYLKKRPNFVDSIVILVTLAKHDSDFLLAISRFYEGWLNKMEKIFASGLNKGEFINLNPTTTALTFNALCNGFIMQSIAGDGLKLSNEARLVLKEFRKRIIISSS